ncbi:transposase [Pseudomonas sp. P3C3]
MNKRFTGEQIIGFLREAEARLPIKELCRRHGFSDASYYLCPKPSSLTMARSSVVGP